MKIHFNLGLSYIIEICNKHNNDEVDFSPELLDKFNDISSTYKKCQLMLDLNKDLPDMEDADVKVVRKVFGLKKL